jgi:hypothetical protein
MSIQTNPATGLNFMSLIGFSSFSRYFFKMLESHFFIFQNNLIASI